MLLEQRDIGIQIGDIVMAWDAGESYYGWFRAVVKSIEPATNLTGAVVTVGWKDYTGWADGVYRLPINYHANHCLVTSNVDDTLNPDDPPICLDQNGNFSVKPGGNISFDFNPDLDEWQFIIVDQSLSSC